MRSSGTCRCGGSSPRGRACTGAAPTPSTPPSAPPTSAGSALALLTPGLDERALAAARELITSGVLGSPVGVRSLDKGDPRRSPRNYWRGPVWANVTWLCAHALDLHGDTPTATALRAQML